MPRLRPRFREWPAPSSAPGDPQRIVGEGLCIRAVDARLAEKGLPQCFDLIAAEILDDEDEPGAPVGIVGPGIENGGDVHDMLYAMQHDGMIGIFGNTDDSLDAQQLGAVARPQEIEEEIEAALGHRRVARQAEGPDRGVVAVDVVMVVVMSVVAMRVAMRVAVIMPMIMSMSVIMSMLAPVRGIFRLGDGFG